MFDHQLKVNRILFILSILPFPLPCPCVTLPSFFDHSGESSHPSWWSGLSVSFGLDIPADVQSNSESLIKTKSFN